MIKYTIRPRAEQSAPSRTPEDPHLTFPAKTGEEKTAAQLADVLRLVQEARLALVDMSWSRYRGKRRAIEHFDRKCQRKLRLARRWLKRTESDEQIS